MDLNSITKEHLHTSLKNMAGEAMIAYDVQSYSAELNTWKYQGEGYLNIEEDSFNYWATDGDTDHEDVLRMILQNLILDHILVHCNPELDLNGLNVEVTLFNRTALVHCYRLEEAYA